MYLIESFRINKGEIEAEFGRWVKKVQDANADTLKQEDLKAQMEDFLQVSGPFVCEGTGLALCQV